MCTQQDRARRRRRTGQKSLWAPNVQIVTDQKIVRALLARRATFVVRLRKTAHDAEPVRPDFPGKPRRNVREQTSPDASGSGIEKSLGRLIPVIAEAETVA